MNKYKECIKLKERIELYESLTWMNTSIDVRLFHNGSCDQEHVSPSEDFLHGVNPDYLYSVMGGAIKRIILNKMKCELRCLARECAEEAKFILNRMDDIERIKDGSNNNNNNKRKVLKNVKKIRSSSKSRKLR